MNKTKYDSPLYNKRAIEVAFDFAPDIYPCYHCGNPVAKGYCCRWCESSDPKGNAARRQGK